MRALRLAALLPLQDTVIFSDLLQSPGKPSMSLENVANSAL